MEIFDSPHLLMKTIRWLAPLLLISAWVCPGLLAAGADAPPELRGMLVAGESREFSLSTAGGAESGWVKVGGDFNGWTLVDYRADDEAVVVRKGETEVVLKLAGATIKPLAVKATVAEADELLRQMHFEEMLSKSLEQQRKAMEPMLRQMMGKQPGVDKDAMVALQMRIADEMWKGLEPEKLRGEVAGIYADVFTRDEILGLGDFYATTAGKAMIEKQPEVQQRMMAVMMPRMMSAMPRVQQIAKEFAAEQAAKAKANAEAATPAATP